MSSYISTTGLVLRETAYKDSSKILTVLTGDEGKLTVSARGALRKNSKLAAATQLLVFSELTLYSGRDRWTLTEARSVEQFQGLRNDIVLLALGSYFAEVAEAIADEDSPGPELLPLCLNALFALSGGLKPPALVKPALELRFTAAAGLAPLLSHCAQCGRETRDSAYLDLYGGNVNCAEHARSGNSLLGPGALSAARHIISCDYKKLFSFAAGEAAMRELYSAAEKYILVQLDRGFRTLDYYKRLLIPDQRDTAITASS